jgi:hypothetical protein
MYMKLDEEVEGLLCCSLCKSDLKKSADCFICTSCGLRFPSRVVKTAEKNEELAFDFRIIHPDYCVPEGLKSWSDAQAEYEHFSERGAERDTLKEYLDEIDSVREIYTVEYHLEGKVLDVGGHQGRLRHYLGSNVSLYVSADYSRTCFTHTQACPSPATSSRPALSTCPSGRAFLTGFI